MPAVSKAQQQAASIALAAKRGKIKPHEVQGASAEMYNSMSDSDLEDFASTDTKRLPDRKEEQLREYIRKYIKEIINETDNMFKDGQRVKNKITGETGTITMASPFTVRVIWDDYKETMKKSDRTPSSMVYKINKAKQYFEPVLDEYDTNPLAANGHVMMGSVGDASFIGPDGKMQGNSKKPVYKTPKSSVHYKKGKFPSDPDFYDEDNWETDKKKSYINDKSVPKTSIHNQHFNEKLGIPMSADGVIDGGPRSMDPIAGKKTKKKKFADASKYGYPKEQIDGVIKEGINDQLLNYSIT